MKIYTLYFLYFILKLLYHLGVLSYERSLKEVGTYAYASLSTKDDGIVRISSNGISWGFSGERNGAAQVKFR